MALPLVTIVGRPNVGKSSLLNMLARERISIVDPRAGITRDRVSAMVAHEGGPPARGREAAAGPDGGAATGPGGGAAAGPGGGDTRYFEVVDTGGIGIVDSDHLEDHVEEQIEYAIGRADVILFVVDVQTGPNPLDQRVAERLRRTDKPVIVVANKVDSPTHEAEAGQFARLGHGLPVSVSALHARGRTELLGRILDLLPDAPTEQPDKPVMKLAIVGKRNAGKSTLVNALAGEPRVIVSEIPGTTRDAVDVRFERDGEVFIAIDTAGVRKKSSMDDIDFYSYTRALRSIRRADVVMLLIDALVPVAEVDLKLARAVLDEYKPIVMAVNKWDLARDLAQPEDFNRYLTGNLPQLAYAPIVFMAANTGRNVDAAMGVALGLHAQAHTRMATAPLNAALQKILKLRGPSAKRGTKPVKIYYGTQVAVAPPTIVLFCNDPALVREEYKRFMENRLRELTPFREAPIRLMFRPRGAGRSGE